MRCARAVVWLRNLRALLGAGRGASARVASCIVNSRFRWGPAVVPMATRSPAHPRVPAREGCAAPGTVRCGGGHSQRLPTPGLPHHHPSLRELRAPSSAPVPELLTEKRGICRRGAARGYPVLTPRPRCGGSSHCFTLVLDPCEPLQVLQHLMRKTPCL